LSPDFAPAHAAWAYVLIQDVIHGYTTTAAETLDEAQRRAEAAVALDERDAMAHMVLGRTNLLQCKHADSIAELETAIDLNPSYVDAYHGLGFCLVFSGRVEEALPHFETAIRLSPQDPHLGWFHEMRGWALLILGRYEEAARSANKAVRRPSAPFWAHATYTASLGHLGRLDEARTALEELLRRNPDFSCEFVRKYVYYNKVTAHLDRYIDGLKKAGLE
jgi:tetratricopeptide (TPR) repeat protein